MPNVQILSGKIEKTYLRVSGQEEKSHLTPGEEWIWDNYYLLKEWGTHLTSVPPKSASRVRTQGYLAALYIVLCADGHATRDNIIGYADQYQEHHTLTLPELQIFPEMLRLCLLERISELCEEMETVWQEREQARQVYLKFTELTDCSGRELDVLFANVEIITPAFADSLLRTASEVSSDTTPLRNSLSRRLAGSGQSIHGLIEKAHQNQIYMGVETGNCIRSLSQLRDLHMEGILSRLNRVEQILMEDPAGVFSKMSRETKDAYIKQVYRSARRHHIRPVEAALRIVEEAGRSQCHVGFCIPGLTANPPRKSIKPAVGRTFLFFLLCLLIPVAGPFLFMLSILFSEFYRHYQSKRLSPRICPAMDFSGNIPEHIHVLLVMPALIPDLKRGQELLSQLNRMIPKGKKTNLHCALIGDLPEHTQPSQETDGALLRGMEGEVAKLNAGPGPLCLFYMRPRVYVKTEGLYAGRERKRGALLDFGKYLEEQINKGVLPEIQYIITVDADSVMTYSAMVRLVEQMEHPLNKPVVDTSGALPVVAQGHGLIAPCAAFYSADREVTPFAGLMGGENGFSGYGGRVSEYYYDKTGMGIYSGKCIYVPDLYRLLLENTFAPETLLSHDLIEGAFLRAGYASEVRLYESFPKDVLSYLKRMHRWTRGDWQLLPYMSKKFRDGRGVLRRNPIPATYLEIMHGNLRASTAPVFALLLLLGGTLLCPSLWWLFGGVVLLYVFREFWMSFQLSSFRRGCVELCMLPEKGYRSLDAILRSLYRVYRSKKHLLSWVTAQEAEKGRAKTVGAYYRRMPATWGMGLAAFILVPHLPFWGGVSVLALGLCWCVSPALFYRMGISKRKTRLQNGFQALSGKEQEEIRVLARKIWAYYEDYAGPGDHYLPPDNVQFKPVYSVAHRTSPTNIGFMMVATGIGAEFGYLSPEEACTRLHKVMDTIEQMQQLRGHLYNWYDTISLTPLTPAFISSVDSGNLLACMLTTCGILEKIHGWWQEASLRERLERMYRGLCVLYSCAGEMTQAQFRLPKHPLEQFQKLLDNRETEEDRLAAGWDLLLEAYLLQSTPKSGENTQGALYRGKIREFCENYPSSVLSQNVSGTVERLTGRIRAFCNAMDFSFLFNPEKGMFSVGYHVQEGKLSDSHYDIAASEARLTGAVAAAKGDIPEEYFARLGRRRGSGGKGILLSWSGTAFEYLMPDLFMKPPEGALWDATAEMMLDIQMREGLRKGIPWGVSESCYNVMDLNMNYKYRAFGVSALSVQGKAESTCVVAPYASIMGIYRRPHSVLANLRKFREQGAVGPYGYYEAVDYTPGKEGIVYCFMAHHLGMSLCGIANFIAQDLVSSGFVAGAGMSALEIYAQEQKMKGYGRIGTGHDKKKEDGDSAGKTMPVSWETPEERNFSGGVPMVNILSNGRYTLVTDDTGASRSQWGDVVVAEKGPRIFVNDGKERALKEGIFSPEKSVYQWQLKGNEGEESVCVCAEEDTEIHWLHFTQTPARYTVTAFSDLVLNLRQTYEAHPAFSDLFIITKAVYEDGDFLGLVACRRNRNPEEQPLYGFFGLFSRQEGSGVEFDTDLCKVYGRNNDTDLPISVEKQIPLSGTVGAPINPCLAIRKTFDGENRDVWLCMGLSSDEETCKARLLKYRQESAAKGAFELARTRTLVEREHIGLRKGEWRYFMELALGLTHRREEKTLAFAENALSEWMYLPWAQLKEKLYPFGISGARPLITVMMRRLENSAGLEKLIRFWCMLSFRSYPVDFVVVAFDDGGYLSPIRDLADRLAQKALSGALGFHGELVVVVPSEGRNIQPLIAASDLVFWM